MERFNFSWLFFVGVVEPWVFFMLLQLVVWFLSVKFRCEATSTVVSSLAKLTGVTSFITSLNFTIMKTSLLFPPPLQMPGGGVTVKDVNQQEFVRALAAFLKK